MTLLLFKIPSEREVFTLAMREILVYISIAIEYKPLLNAQEIEMIAKQTNPTSRFPFANNAILLLDEISKNAPGNRELNQFSFFIII
jgi:hypothetical protein